eukprot:CAMPEP_0196659486 /NCGR_PEP_ID=MMETSP1086-20130531/35292_1 /TAXON_ID=77921 /ORGANISM="Cyanoptyche  gloeocystis , Strain SAG4.97" /LENGTH=165 /DNA_ID=CAMNT_0041993499 /DNA_START=232 /DNA_END=728 /DNA_ORIENTATION=-
MTVLAIWMQPRVISERTSPRFDVVVLVIKVCLRCSDRNLEGEKQLEWMWRTGGMFEKSNQVAKAMEMSALTVGCLEVGAGKNRSIVGKIAAAVCGAAYLCNSSCIAATARADPTVDMAGEQQFTETGGVRDWAVCAELPALEVVLVWNANTGRDCEMAGEFVETG